MATIGTRGGGTVVLALAGLGLAARSLLGGALADLRGEVALITGGSRGLGLLLAREFGLQGCKIAICARDGAELEEASDWLRREGVAEVRTFVCDMADPEQVELLVPMVDEQYGRVDILVNNAGIIAVGPALEMTRQDYQRMMNLMFWGLFNATQAVLPQMLERGHGRIVNITSVGGKVSVPHLLPYSCAKFAATGFSEGLHAELASKGIAVTTIVPGELRTGSFENAEFKGQQEQEFRWFAVNSSMPFLALDAERAARQIVVAVRRGQAERILSLPAEVMVRVAGLFPGATASLLALAARTLPVEGGAGAEIATGKEVHRRARSLWLDRLLGFGESAARRFNERPERG